ncbi:uncharacterized protein CANTADRAFT_37282, partial [Suhomyces tanzawaensis NRRL Y-17324]
MRESNYKAVSSNKAAVTITTSLYDRRALDVTSDKPLVNSLNYLTYLVSSLAKVRETLSADGGIERLVEILHECHNATFNLNDTIFNSEKKLLTAWKWTLAFQCLVLVGTRGTEKIRQKVVQAGILPIIATVLDNYLSLHERTFIHANSRHQPALPTTTSTTINSSNSNNSSNNSSSSNNNSSSSNNSSNNNSSSNINSSSNRPANPINLSATGIENTSISTTFPTYFNNNHANNLTNDDYDNLTLDQLFKLIRNTSVMNDVRRRHMIIHIIKKLKEEKELEILDDRFLNDGDYEMDNNLHFLTNLYLQDFETNKALINSKIAVRNFTETGVVIPRDDDIVWSLQLLAYISKYSYLKDVLQNTHLVIDMSIRDKQLKIYLEKQMKLSIKKNMAFKMKPRPKITPRSRKSKRTETLEGSASCEENSTYLKRFNPSASTSPQMLDDINAIHNDNFLLDEDKFELYNKAKQTCLTENAEVEDEDEDDEIEDDEDVEVELDKAAEVQIEPEEKCTHNIYNEAIQEEAMTITKSDYVNQLYEAIVNCESIVDDLERDIKLFQINEKMNKYIEVESKRLVQTIILKRKEKKEFLTKKWNYDDYTGFDIDEKNEDQDDSLIEYKKVNLFPIVEKFTFLTGTDMYYWSGVIMRNSCRRNELRGSVRQCGNLECGKWERYPREFLKCRRCKRTKYCSRECQMRAWHCHRNWCVPSNSSTTTSTTNTSAQTP